MEARAIKYGIEKLTPEQASAKARQFILSLGQTPKEKSQRLKERYPVSYYHHFDGNREEVVPYISSHQRGETKGKPTIVIFSGVFQEVREWPIEMATIAHVFDVPTIVVDYASLANKGIDHMFEELPRMLSLFEADRKPARILIGESLGGLVAQSIAFAGLPETNVKGLLLSHTIPPDKLNKSLYKFLKALSYATPIIPIQLARRIIDKVTEKVQNQYHTEGDVEELSRELQKVGEILRGENGALTKERATGFLRAAVGAVDKSRHAPQSIMCVEVVASPEDQVVGYADEKEWRKYHRRANLTSLAGTEGHFKPGLRKEKVLIDSLIPLLAQILNGIS